MAILNIFPNDPGHDADVPRVQRIDTNDTLATIITAGYLNEAIKSNLLSVSPTDLLLISISQTTGLPATSSSLFNASYSAGNWTLTQLGAVSLPIDVANGGTGRTTLTAYDILAGGTISTGNVQSISVGTTGQKLTSNGPGALPSMQTELNGTKVINSVALTHTNLAAAATVTVLPAASGTSQYQLTGIYLNGVTGTNFSGGGGDRNLHLTDGSHEWTLVPAANLQALTNDGWGSVAVPYPAIVAISQASAAGARIYAEYANGSADYTAGSVTLTLVYSLITA